MRYGWTNKDIIRDIKRIEKLASIEKDIRKKCYYIRTIDYLNATLDENMLSNIDVKKTKNHMMCDIQESIKFYKRYYDLIEMFYSICNKSYDVMSGLYNESCDLDYKFKYIKHEDTLSLVHDFYKVVDKEFFDCFLRIYNNRYKLIRFSNSDIYLNGLVTSGSCVSVGGLDKCYITVSNDRGVLKPINLSHECGHGILNIYNSNLLYNQKDEFASEIGSIFFELAFNYDIGKNFDSFDSALNNIQELFDRFNITSSLMLHQVLVKVWEKNNYKVDNNFYKIARQEYNLNREKVDEALNTSLTNEGVYAIDYMIALNILNIYKQDKKSAIKLLKDITNYDKYDSYEMINVLIPNMGNFSYEIDDINSTYETELKKLIIK